MNSIFFISRFHLAQHDPKHHVSEIHLRSLSRIVVILAPAWAPHGLLSRYCHIGDQQSHHWFLALPGEYCGWILALTSCFWYADCSGRRKGGWGRSTQHILHLQGEENKTYSIFGILPYCMLKMPHKQRRHNHAVTSWIHFLWLIKLSCSTVIKIVLKFTVVYREL